LVSHFSIARFLTLFCFCIFIRAVSFAQQVDSVKIDSVKAESPDTARLKSGFTLRLLPEEHSPKVAGIASAIVPGLGQAYNKKYWKIPIVYAALATSSYFIYYNYTIYSNFRKAYDLRIDADSTTFLSSFNIWYVFSTQTVYLTNYSDYDLQTLENTYRRYVDISVLVTFAVYALNIVDAVVDAHLYNFDVSDNLSMNVKPFVIPSLHSPATAGLTLTLSLK